MSAQNDAAFLRMFLLILGGLVVFTVIILVAANSVSLMDTDEPGVDRRLQAQIEERIRPVGSVNVADPAAAATAETASVQSGAELVAGTCGSCHQSGVLGAPKIGDKEAWTTRLDVAGGIDGLTASAISGKGSMPAKGGAMVSDAEIRAAVEHMLVESGVDAGAAAAPVAEAPVPPAEPVAEVQAMAGDAAEPGAPAADPAHGKSVYDTACFVCHGSGAAGAPKLGEAAAWEARIAQGMDTLVANAINGKGGMPPKGGRMDLSDADIRDAVVYMAGEAQ